MILPVTSPRSRGLKQHEHWVGYLHHVNVHEYVHVNENHDYDRGSPHHYRHHESGRGIRSNHHGCVHVQNPTGHSPFWIKDLTFRNIKICNSDNEPWNISKWCSIIDNWDNIQFLRDVDQNCTTWKCDHRMWLYLKIQWSYPIYGWVHQYSSHHPNGFNRNQSTKDFCPMPTIC